MNELLDHLMQEASVWQGHRATSQHLPVEATGHPDLDRSLGGSGWPRGALSECLLAHEGIGELQLALPLIRRVTQRGQMVFWVNPPHTPYAPELNRQGVGLDQVVVVRTDDDGDLLWTLESCLRSPVTGLVMAWPGRLASRAIRRLQLAAEAGDNVCLLFRAEQEALQSSPAALRLKASPISGTTLHLDILKRRGGWPGQSCTIRLCDRTGLPESTATESVVAGPWQVAGA